MRMTIEEIIHDLEALCLSINEETNGCEPVCIGEAIRVLTESMTGNKYQALASRTINDNLEISKVELHALHGLSGEVGEIHSLYQKVYQGHKMDDDHLMKEIGDLMWFVAELCTARGLFLEDVMKLNIDKLKKRFPDGFEVEKSLHRKEGDI